jgi:dihydrofolate reductase
MRKITYYVATSLDGYIAGANDDISGFVSGGSGVERYLADLAGYDTVIMGRNTYEFGYKFGLKPGQPAYPHMTHYVFSNTLSFENPHPNVHVVPPRLEEVDKIKGQNGTDIYLCGGGKFAGWLLDHDRIDILKLKLNPFIAGHGVRLFGDSKNLAQFELADTTRYDQGLQIMTYRRKG